MLICILILYYTLVLYALRYILYAIRYTLYTYTVYTRVFMYIPIHIHTHVIYIYTRTSTHLHMQRARCVQLAAVLCAALNTQHAPRPGPARPSLGAARRMAVCASASAWVCVSCHRIRILCVRMHLPGRMWIDLRGPRPCNEATLIPRPQTPD